MNDVQSRLGKLKKKKWTLAAISDRIGCSWYTVQRWDTGESYPNLEGAVLMALDQLLTETPPMRKRYAYNEPTATA